jgi:hypothetical protein
MDGQTEYLTIIPVKTIQNKKRGADDDIFHHVLNVENEAESFDSQFIDMKKIGGQIYKK